MSVHFVLYTKPNCIQCHMTAQVLEQKHAKVITCYHGNQAETNVIDPDSTDPKKAAWSKQKIESLIQKTGLHAMPIVKVYNDQTNQLVDQWGGFQPTKINQWTQPLTATPTAEQKEG